MEDRRSLKKAAQMAQSVSLLKTSLANLDQVAVHCKRDHLSPMVMEERNKRSCYYSSYSPPKQLPSYNHPAEEREHIRFRKHESSTLLLPAILDHSHYQTSYKGSTPQKEQVGKQNESWFMKASWATAPSSNYQKDYSKKDAAKFNRTNLLRSNNNNLLVLRVKGSKEVSCYARDFKGQCTTKQPRVQIVEVDHLRQKENLSPQFRTSEYQRRFLPIQGQPTMAGPLARHRK